jgi:hypothetical protein
VAERGDQVAIHYDSPVTGARSAPYTYADLLDVKCPSPVR